MRRTLGILISATLILALAGAAAAQGKKSTVDPSDKVRRSLLSKAQMLQYKGEHDKAIALYRMAAAQAPGDLGTTLLLSGALLQRGRVEQARKAWDRWMTSSKHRAGLKVAAEHLVARLMRDGKHRQAEAVCDTWLQQLKAWDRFAVLGDVYWKVGDKVRAIQLYTLQLATEPSRSTLALRVEAWHRAAGMPRAAMAALLLYLKHSPADLAVTRRFISSLERQKKKKPERIRAAWERWLKASRDPGRYQTVGDYYRKAGQQDLTVRYYSRHLKQDPSDLEVVAYLAGVWGPSGQKDRVAQMYLAAVKDRPNLPVVRVVTTALESLGRKQDAEDVWVRWHKGTRRTDKDLILGRYFLGREKKELALPYLRRNAARSPKDVEGMKLLARALLGGGKRAEGRKVLDRFLKGSTMRKRYSVVADIYLEAGDVGTAKKHYLLHMRKSRDDRWSLRTFTQKLVERQQFKAAADLWREYCKVSKRQSRHEYAGDFFRRLNRHREAIAHYKKHLTIEPNDSWVVQELAEQLDKTGRRGAADKVWTKFVTNGSDTGRHERAASYYMRTGRTKRALALYRRHLQVNPQRLRAHRTVATALSRAGKVKEAVALWETAVQSLPDRNRYEAAGDFFNSLGRRGRALKAYRQNLQLNPRQLRAYGSLARALRQDGKVDEGVTLWVGAVKTLTDKQRYEEAGNYMGYAQRWKEAAAMYREHLKLNPKRQRSYENLAKALHRTGKTSEAVALWEKAVRTLTDRYRYQRAGDFFKNAGIPNRALEMYRKHHKLRASRWSCRRLTRALRDAGKTAEATAVWEKAVLTLSDRSRYEAAGDFMRDVGKKDRAMYMYRKHLELNSRSTSAHRSLARSLANQGKTAEAVALWEKALRVTTDTNRFQRAGEFFLSIGRVDRAIALFKKYVKAAPNNVWAHRSLTRALTRAGRHKEATAAWLRALRNRPTDYCFSSAGDYFRGLGRMDQAIKIARLRLKKTPSASAADQLARLLWDAGKNKQAVAVWEKSVRTLSDNYRYRWAGHFYRGIGRLDRAVVMYRKHLTQRPNEIGTRGYIGRALVRMGKTKQAEAMWEKALRNSGDRYRYQSAGDFFGLIGRHGRAVELYRKYLALNPSNSSAARTLARALVRAGKSKEAAALVEKSTRTMSDRYRYARAGNFYYENEQWGRAEAMYRKHLALVTTDSSAGRTLARILLSAGKVKEARALWEKSIKGSTDRYRYNNAGHFYERVGEPERALAMYREHMKLNPDNRWARDSITKQLLRMGRNAEAVAAWDEGLKRCKDGHCFAPAGRMHHQLGNYKRAVELLRKYLRAQPTNIWTHDYLADALVGVGKIKEADRLWQRWLRAGPSKQLNVVAAFYQRVGQPQRALPLLRKYLLLNPGTCHGYSHAAAALWTQGKAAEADKIWARGIKQSISLGCLKYAADYFRATGRAPRAIKLYRRHLAMTPMAQGAWLALAGALITTGRGKDAEAALAGIAPRMRPSFRLGEQGLFLARAGKLTVGLGLLKKFVAAYPGAPRSHQLLAGAYLAAGKKDEAAAVWKRGLPRCAGCNEEAAEFYQRVGRCKDAVPLYLKVLASNHQSISLRSQLAHCLKVLGKPREADKHLAAAEALAGRVERHAPLGTWSYRGRNSSFASDLNSVAWLYLNHDRFKAKQKHAVTLARKATRLSPFNKHLLGTLIFALSRDGKGAEALRLVKRRLAWNPRSAWAHLEKALAHLSLGQRDLARTHLARSRALDLVPEPDLAREQQALEVRLKTAAP